METIFANWPVHIQTCHRGRLLSACIVLVAAISVPSFAQYTNGNISTNSMSQKSVAPTEDLPFSAELKSRLFMPYTNTTGNGWLNELNLGYDLNSRWSLGLWGGYIQNFDAAKTSLSEWEDTEFSITYSALQNRKHFPKPTLELTAGAVAPTAFKYDREQTETGGIFLRDHFIMDYSYVKFEQKLTLYQYFYRNRSYVDVLNQPKPTQNSDSSEDNYALLDTSLSPAADPVLVSNSVNYITAKLIGILPIIVKPLLLRNEIWFESYQNFDGSAINIIHDLPGLGYKWSGNVSTWFSLDCNKNLSKDGSVFDKNNIISLLTVYLSI